MRKLIVPLLLCTPFAVADESAADLFYKAFWFEQAGGDLAEAETLYRRIVDQHQRSPEAPRAILGLCRLLAARGDDVDALVKLLETDHPNSERELDQAREIAVRLKSQFDPQFTSEDSPIDRKLKNLYLQIIDHKAIDNETKAFLADLGPVAHPMLRLVLRQTDHRPVRFAVEVLMMQRTETAHAILEEAIKDKRVLFKSALIDGLPKAIPPRLLAAMGDLYDSAAPHLRGSIVYAAARAVSEPEPRAAAFAILTAAAADKDAKVRGRATSPHCAYHLAPDAYAAAVVGLIERRAENVHVPLGALPFWANREGLAARIETILGSRPEFKNLRFNVPGGPGHEAGAVVMARAVLAQRARGVDVDDMFGHILAVASWSPPAAALLLDAALDSGDAALASRATAGLSKAAGKLGAAAAPLRRKALELIYDETRGAAARAVLTHVGLGPDHWDVLIAVLEAHKEKGIAPGLLSGPLVDGVGAARATVLARYCVDSSQYDDLLAAGRSLTGADATGFFDAVVPHVGTQSAGYLRTIAQKRGFDAVIASAVLGYDAAWGWRMPDGTRTRHAWGPLLLGEVRDALGREPLRSKLLARSADPRYEIARTAIDLADDADDEASTRALIAALQSPHPKIRKEVLGDLATRGEAAADALLAFALRPETGRHDRMRAFKSLGHAGSAKHAAPVAGFVQKEGNRVEDTVWRALFRLAPDRAVELALEAVAGGGDADYRESALEILTKTSDPRRIDVFRKILRSELAGDVDRVLKTVADQYLIELGTEILRHLRSPDHSVRESAKAAIESLKFYVEAKKTFESK